MEVNLEGVRHLLEPEPLGLPVPPKGFLGNVFDKTDEMFEAPGIQEGEGAADPPLGLIGIEEECCPLYPLQGAGQEGGAGSGKGEAEEEQGMLEPPVKRADGIDEGDDIAVSVKSAFEVPDKLPDQVLIMGIRVHRCQKMD